MNLPADIINSVTIHEAFKCFQTPFINAPQGKAAQNLGYAADAERKALALFSDCNARLVRQFEAVRDLTEGIYMRFMHSPPNAEGDPAPDISRTETYLKTMHMYDAPYLRKMGEYLRTAEEAADLHRKLSMIQVKRAFLDIVLDQEEDKKAAAAKSKRRAKLGFSNN